LQSRDGKAQEETIQRLVSFALDEIETLRKIYPFLSAGPAASLETVPAEAAQGVPSPRSISEQFVHIEREMNSPDAQVGVDSGMASDTFNQLLNTLGEMMSEQAALHHAVSRLEQIDLLETFGMLVRESHGDMGKLRAGFEPLLVKWSEQASVVARTEAKIGTATSQLHEVVRSHYLKPASSLLDVLQAHVDELCLRSSRQLELHLEGGEILLDRSTLDLLEECIVFGVENIVLPGLPGPQERSVAGQAVPAGLQISLLNQGGNLQVNIQADGRGSLDEAGLQAAQAWAEMHHWLYVDKSTSQKTNFQVSLPIHRSIVDGMVVRSGRIFYIIAIDMIRRILRLDASEIVHSSAEGTQTLLRLGDELLPVHSLAGHASDVSSPLLIVIDGGIKPYALGVDEVIGQQSATVLPLSRNLSGIQNATGFVVLGDGEIGLVLDTNRAH
jgi:two-component system, chemotaxis family, sensor kinase CheA